MSQAINIAGDIGGAAAAFAGPEEIVPVENPLSENFGVLRPSVLPGLLDAVAHNRRREQRDVRLFEVGNRFSKSRGENPVVACAWTGASALEHWSGGAREVDFFDIKAVAERVCQALRVDDVATEVHQDEWLVAGRAYRLGIASPLGVHPDQRIQEDVRHLSELSADLGVNFTQQFTLLCTFVGVLWLLSENVALQLRQPWIKIGTDAGGVDPDSAMAPVHPRSYGTYPRILGRYVREQRVLGLEDAVRKMSSAVATRLAIRDRGILAEGYAADVIVFDPATISDRATFEQPHQYAEGVSLVVVNGQVVFENGQMTAARPGRVLYGPAKKP